MEVNPYIYKCPVFEDYHDPVAVRRFLLLASQGKFNAWLTEQRSGDLMVVCRAQELLLPVVREAFKLPAVDKATGNGVADEQVIEVLNHFLGWLEGKG